MAFGVLKIHYSSLFEIIGYLLIAISMLYPWNFINLPLAILSGYSGYFIVFIRYRGDIIKYLLSHRIYTLFFLYSLYIVLGGFLKCKNQDDYACCFNFFFIPLLMLLLPFFQKGKHLFRIRYLFLFFLFFSLLKLPDYGDDSMNSFSGYVAISYLPLLFFPFLKKSNKLIVIVFCLVSVFFDLTDRTNILMMSICLGLMLLNFLPLNRLCFKFIYCILSVLPFFFLLLAVLGVFNVFSLADDGRKNVDTRTFLYTQVATSMDEPNFIVFGKSAVASYRSVLVYTNKGEKYFRQSCEVGALEFFMRGGIIYLLLFLLLIHRMAWNCICNSNNKIVKILAIYCICYFNVFFIELQMGNNAWSLSFWLALAIIGSRDIRNLSDEAIPILLTHKIKV